MEEQTGKAVEVCEAELTRIGTNQITIMPTGSTSVDLPCSKALKSLLAPYLFRRVRIVLQEVTE